ncbi:hypothetical protein MKW94_026554 [Papaver nudicaule]|uniref:Uncharacterized protein n=1 Tax=Papaver nudicaule TaxID=74823 RepID=A0AA41VEX3_PAPNU|nr:hypothetical protein [Papaver nudicaule]
MDFHSLSRRELQALCKKNKIPANLTNVAMADALSSLTMVDGVEDIGNPMPETPLTSRTSRKPVKPQFDVVEPKTSMGFARHSRESMKEVPVDNHAYSTRRSTRLQQKSEVKVSESVQKVGERSKAIKMDMLSKEEYDEEMKSASEITDVHQMNEENVKVVKQEQDAISEDSSTTLLLGEDSASEVTSAPTNGDRLLDVSLPLVKTENLVDTGNFDFETMKDSMEEVMNNLETEGCNLDAQQEDLIMENAGEESEDSSDVVDDIVNKTPSKTATSEFQAQGTPLRSSTKKKAVTTPKSFIKVLDDNKEIDGSGKVGRRSSSKKVTEEKENKGDNTAQRKLKSTSVRQLKKMIKELTLVDNKNTISKGQQVEKRSALQPLRGNCLVEEKEE